MNYSLFSRSAYALGYAPAVLSQGALHTIVSVHSSGPSTCLIDHSKEEQAIGGSPRTSPTRAPLNSDCARDGFLAAVCRDAMRPVVCHYDHIIAVAYPRTVHPSHATLRVHALMRAEERQDRARVTGRYWRVRARSTSTSM